MTVALISFSWKDFLCPNLLIFYVQIKNLQQADIKSLQDEIRKLKAVIVKHENRIRALEAIEKSRDEENNITEQKTQAPDSTSTTVRTNLAPDEV